MKTSALRRWFFAGAFCALSASASAQLIELRATINATQETSPTNSSATGSAVMLYDVATNTFDLWITINGFSNTLSASHVHEGAAGVAGPVVTNLGAESVYTRNGTTLTAAFRGVAHGGDKLKLLQSGAYLNFHTSDFPAGEVRGQLIAQPKRLTAIINAAQERAAFPASTINSDAYGAAIMLYHPATNKVSLRISLYGFTNTLTASHYHEGLPGVSGPVVTNLGAGTVSNYVRVGNWITGTFNDLTYMGDVVKLLTGGAYLNFHSNVYAPGEIRGQVIPSDDVSAAHLGNASARGFVGTGAQVLIGGLNVTGPEPIRVLITAKGPSLTAFGVAGVLANPTLNVHDSAGRLIAQNDDYGAVAAGTDIALYPAPPAALEAAVLLVLPPGNYTAIMSGAGASTGVGLLETYDVRDFVGSTAAGAMQMIARNAADRDTGPVAALQLADEVEWCRLPTVVATAASAPLAR